MPKPNGYVLNYVISTTYSFNYYSIWNFTHKCNPTASVCVCILPPSTIELIFLKAIKKKFIDLKFKIKYISLEKLA